MQQECPHCAAALEADDRFCGECGCDLQPTQAAVAPSPQASSIADSKARRRPYWIAAVAVLLLPIAYMAFLALDLEYGSPLERLQRRVEIFGQTVRISISDDAIAYGDRGLNYATLDRFDEALKDMDQAIGNSDDFFKPMHYYRRAIVNELKGDLEGAEQDIAEAVRLRPDDSDYRVRHAEVLIALGRWNDAVAEAREAIRLGHKEDAVYEKLFGKRAP